MLKPIADFAVVGAIFLLAIQCVAAQESQESLRESAIQKAIEHARRFTVQIETIGGLETINGIRTTTGPTTGLVVSADGYVISSAFNFIGQPASILIRDESGERMPAKIIGRDLSRKLVLLKFEPKQPLNVPIPVAVNEMQVGQTVIALGRAMSGDNINVSTGILSARNRIWGKAIQTDAKVSPVNFGGPLVDLQGQVLGVLVPLSPEAETDLAGLEWYDSGIGFAVPLADVVPQLDALMAGRTLRPGLLGAAFRSADLFADPAVVATVFPATPAAASGLLAGDEIVAVEGQIVSRLAQLKNAIGPRYENDRVSVQVRRDDQLIELEIQLVGEIEPYESPLLGILPGRSGDLTIRWVISGSPAQRAGVKPGDHIHSMNGQPMQSWEDVKQALHAAGPTKTLTIGVVRNGNSLNFDSKLTHMDADPIGDCPAIVVQPDGANALLTEIHVPEVANRCDAIIPLTRGPKGILVWLTESSEFDPEQVQKIWQKECISRNTIVLFPRPADLKQWRVEETEFINKAVNLVVNKYDVDNNRIAIAGSRTAGSMAALTAFGQRDLFCGVFCVDSVLPEKVQNVATDPVHRLLIYVAQSGSFAQDNEIKESIQRLRARKFAVHHDVPADPSIDALSKKILSWVDTLDRL